MTAEPSLQPRPIAAGPAFAGWLTATFAGLVLSGPILLGLGDTPTVGLVVSLVVRWALLLGVVVWLSRLFGTQRVRVDVGATFRPVDALGLVGGVVVQLLIPLLYMPLRAAWPNTFGDDAVAKRARDLFADVHDLWAIVLVACVVIGAPVVEEVVYRGLLQRSAGAVVDPLLAWVLISMLFAAVHMSVAELPGLVVAGLSFGAWVYRTGRIGGAICTHVGFNAAGVAMVFLK